MTAEAQQQQQTIGAPQHEANIVAERKQADDLFIVGEILKPLPLYEDLFQQDPTVAFFAERHGSGLLRKAATIADPAAQKLMQEQALEEIRRAPTLGDNSALHSQLLCEGHPNR